MKLLKKSQVYSMIDENHHKTIAYQGAMRALEPKE